MCKSYRCRPTTVGANIAGDAKPTVREIKAKGTSVGRVENQYAELVFFKKRKVLEIRPVNGNQFVVREQLVP